MSSTKSVSILIPDLRTGDADAARYLFQRYFPQLVQLARQKLGAGSCRAADEEDVALSAFGSFCRRVADDEFAKLQDRHDLWRLLATFTVRKASRLRRDEGRQKRRAPAASPGSPVEQLVGDEPTPDFTAQMAEACQRLLDRLDDARLREIALWKLEGYTNDEIASKLGCVPRTIERKLNLIRLAWEQEVGG